MKKGIPMINQKYIMSTVLTFLLLIGGYFVVLNTDSVSVSVHNEQSKQEVSVSSGSTIHTKTNPPSNWGDSPFSTGKTTPVIKTPAPRPRVSTPNLEWKTRTVTLKDGRKVTYEFGKGNPKEVAVSPQEFKAAYARCGTSEDPLNEGPFCNEYDGYVSKETEQDLLTFLSNPNWNKLLSECREHLSYQESISQGTHELYDFIYNQVSAPTFRDIDTWLTIDQNSGRKEIDKGKLFGLQAFIYHSTYEFWIQKNNQIVPYPYKNPRCVDIYGKEIMNQLALLIGSYLYSTRESFGISSKM